MKKVVTIQELQTLIPECRALEGITFTDMKNLITSIIDSVEKSGQWEYVQYISGKPSLFVVKLKQQDSLNYAKPTYQYNDAAAEIANHYAAVQVSQSSTKNIKTSVKSKNSKEPEQPIQNDKIEEKTEVDSTKLFPDIKLPW